MLHYDDPHIHGASSLARWLGHTFPAHLAASDLPEHVLAASMSIFSRQGEFAELGLQPDGKNLGQAPVESMKHYLNLLHELWVDVRCRIGTGGEWVAPDDHLAWDWLSLVGQTMRQVPVLLVRWS